MPVNIRLFSPHVTQEEIAAYLNETADPKVVRWTSYEGSSNVRRLACVVLSGDSAGSESAYQIAVNHGFVGTEVAWLNSLIGQDGAPGGPPGPEGLSAYEVAVLDGFTGSEVEWLASLLGAAGSDGPQGLPGDDGANGTNGTNGTNGQDGAPGAPGAPGPNQVTTSTATTITGLLKGDGATVSAASAPTDYVATGDARLSDARTPTTHAASHQANGSDAIQLDALAAPNDSTTLDATTALHGLLPKLPGGTTTFLRADGTFAAAALGDLASSLLAPTGDTTLAAQTCVILARSYTVASGTKTVLGLGARMRIL
jgi:hypothetical protein